MLMDAENLKHWECTSSGCRAWHETQITKLLMQRTRAYRRYAAAFPKLKARAAMIRDPQHRTYFQTYLDREMGVVVNASARAASLEVIRSDPGASIAGLALASVALVYSAIVTALAIRHWNSNLNWKMVAVPVSTVVACGLRLGYFIDKGFVSVDSFVCSLLSRLSLIAVCIALALFVDVWMTVLASPALLKVYRVVSGIVIVLACLAGIAVTVALKFVLIYDVMHFIITMVQLGLALILVACVAVSFHRLRTLHMAEKKGAVWQLLTMLALSCILLLAAISRFVTSGIMQFAPSSFFIEASRREISVLWFETFSIIVPDALFWFSLLTIVLLMVLSRRFKSGLSDSSSSTTIRLEVSQAEESASLIEASKKRYSIDY